MTTTLMIAKTAMIGAERRSHARYETPASAKPPIKEAMVGAIMLSKPDAVAKAATMTSLLEPTRSAIGAITGIVAAAKPDDDGTMNDIGK